MSALALFGGSGFLNYDVQAAMTIWDRIAETEDFKDLMAAKARFIVPATVFFVVYYFALPVLVGYWPEVMRRPVFGVVNVAYLFALSQFFMAWLLAWIYTRAAARFDAMAKRILERHAVNGVDEERP